MFDKNELMAVREYQESDKNFIFATWLRGLYNGNSLYGCIPMKVFMDNYHNYIEAVLKSPNTKVNVAYLKEDPEVILGYSVLSQDGAKLHWTYVKKPWRNIGIAKSLTPSTINTVTNITKVGLSILRNHKDIQFNPFVMI